MIDGDYALAFTTGLVTAVNPCGFAMLPAYLSFFLGDDGRVVGADGSSADAPGTTAAVGRALVVSVAMVLGFTVVFTVLGMALRGAFKHLIGSVSGYATTAVALLLVAAGIAVIAGRKLPLSTPKLNKGGRSGSFASMFVFGVSYAVASLGCALGPFINTVLNSSRRFGTVSGLVAMVLFSLGMGLVITALTVSLALSNGGLVKVLRRAMRYVDRVAGVFLLLAGVYLLIYGIEEIRISRGTIVSSGITRTGAGFAGRIQTFLNRQDPVLVGLVLATVVAAATAAVLLGRRRAEPAP